MTGTQANTTSSTDTPQVDHDAKKPVNVVHFSDSGKQFIIESCVICGERHAHGSKDVGVADGDRSHRAAHCHSVNHTGGYYLTLAADAEPPEWWHDWVTSERGGVGK
jgi:hypothetical protein